MTPNYTAKMYLDKDEILQNTGDDMDQLYTWMLAQAEDKFGNIRGEVIDNMTQEVVRQFRKVPPD
ncbi:MAG: hypothetical protein ACYCQI_00840 [Gammaproteobacteria bacterium]